MSERKYREQVNPTFNTAQQTLHMLAGSGNKDAISYLQNMNIENGLMPARNEVKIDISEDDGKRLMAGASLGVEARYEAISNLIAKNESKNIFDIACGYTPRALSIYKAGCDYVGLDVPVVVEKMNEVAKKLNIQMSHDVYISGDAVNPDSLLAAAGCLGNPLFITSEGLLQYLNKNELGQLIHGIREVLKVHGGAWYSSDMEVAYDRLAVAFMNDPQALQKFASSRAELGEKTNIYFSAAKFESLEEKIQFFEERGLHVERIPFYEESMHLNLLNAYPEKTDDAKKLLSSFRIWKTTVKEEGDTAQKTETEHAAQKQTIESVQYCSKRKGDCLSLQVSGRVDTLSAPGLLKIFEEEYEKQPLTELVVDATSMEYISSAGLRTLLIMRKKMGENSVKVVHANDVVKEIFETTGFDALINLC